MQTQWKPADFGGERWMRQDWLSAPASTLRVDPYAVWADLTDYVDLGGKPDEWVAITLELGDVTPAEILKRHDNQGAGEWIRIHRRYCDPVAVKGARYCTAIVRKEFFAKLMDEHPAGHEVPLRKVIRRFELGLPIVDKCDLERDAPPQRESASYEAFGDAQCVVGIIDDGIAFAHQRFRRADNSTRVDFFWDQGCFAPDTGRLYYGREHTRDDIDGYFRKSTHGNSLVEDAVYELGQYRQAHRRIPHGTHVLDIACGEDPKNVTDLSPRIVAVQLQVPSRRTRDRSAGWLGARALDGIWYILECAERIKPNCPVVINLSFGNIAGPHDGSSMLERAIDELIALRREQQPDAPLVVVIAAGNSNLARCHARLSLPAGKCETLRWRVLPDDPTPNFLEIWLPESQEGDKGFSIRVTTPTGDASARLNKGSVTTWGSGTSALCTVVYLNRVATGDRNMVLIAIAPTASVTGRPNIAPSGTWQVEITNCNEDGGALEVNAWIQRDDTPFDFPRHGRQSRFDDLGYQRFEGREDPPSGSRVYGRRKADDDGNETTYIKRAGTINSLSTGLQTIVVSGFRRSDGAIAAYSSSGPGLALVDKLGCLGAVSDESAACHGVIAAGSRSGCVGIMDGTSVAAPGITRRIAEQVALGCWRGQIGLYQDVTNQEKGRPRSYTSAPPRERAGAGRIRTEEVIKVNRRENP